MILCSSREVVSLKKVSLLCIFTYFSIHVRTFHLPNFLRIQSVLCIKSAGLIESGLRHNFQGFPRKIDTQVLTCTASANRKGFREHPGGLPGKVDHVCRNFPIKLLDFPVFSI